MYKEPVLPPSKKRQAKDHGEWTVQRCCVPGLIPTLSPYALESIAGTARYVWAPVFSNQTGRRIRRGRRTGGVSVSRIYCAPFPSHRPTCIPQTESQVDS